MLVFGRNVIEEMLNNHEKINKVYLQKNFKEEKLISSIQKYNIEIEYKEKYELDKLVKGTHQGIIGVVKDYEYCELEDIIDEEVIIILDHLEDPHNLGAIIRTAEAAGVKAIIIPKDRSVQVNSTVFKVSAGAIENIKIARVTNIVNTMKDLKKNGYWIYGTDMNQDSFKDCEYSEKMALVIGNEGSGMSRLVKENCDFIISIPMKGQINSLNASVAAGILLFDISLKRK